MKRNIGFKIKNIRNNQNDGKGMSMEDFGKLFEPKASKGVVSNWENNYNYPNEVRLKRIAELGGISVDELLYGSDKKQAAAYFDDAIKNISEDGKNRILEYLDEPLLWDTAEEVTAIILENRPKTKEYYLDYNRKYDFFNDYIGKESFSLAISKVLTNERPHLYVHFKMLNVINELMDRAKEADETEKTKLHRVLTHTDNYLENVYEVYGKEYQRFTDDATYGLKVFGNAWHVPGVEGNQLTD